MDHMRISGNEPSSTYSSISSDQMTFYASACMHIPFPESLHLKCLKTPPPANGFTMIGCRLSRNRILSFASLTVTDSSSSNFTASICIYIVLKVMENATLLDDGNNATHNNFSPYSNLSNSTVPLDTGSSFTMGLAVFFVLQQIMVAVSLFGNSVVIIVFGWFLTSSVTNKLMINLAVNDVCASVMFWLQVPYIFIPSMKQNMYLCFFRYQSSCLMAVASQFSVTLMTLDRYIAICRNGAYQQLMTTRTATLMIIVAWSVPVAIIAIPFMGFNKWNDKPDCAYPSIFVEWYYLVYAGTNCTMMFLAVCMYVLILRKAFFFMNRSLKTARNIGNQERLNSLQKSFRSAKVTGTITIASILCKAPSQAYQLK